MDKYLTRKLDVSSPMSQVRESLAEDETETETNEKRPHDDVSTTSRLHNKLPT
jgi:hypothetical protein